MTIFHLSSEKGWRGGENQFALICRGFEGEFDQHLMVRRGSELEKRMAGFPVTAVAGFSVPNLAAAALRLRRLAGRSPSPALFHAHCSKSLTVALFAAAGLRIPVVVSRRNAFPIHSRWKYRSADAVIAVSRETRRILLGAGVDAERVHLIPDAVDPSRFEGAAPIRPGATAGDVVVLCAAALEAEKDHATLLNAWQRVEHAAPGARLLLAGSGPLEAELKAQASGLGLQRVSFLGWRADLPALLAGADLAALASRNEGLASFICEAQFCGVPAVATNAGGLPDALEDGETGLLSPVGDAEALARNLMSLIANADLRRRFGAAAARRAHERFALNRILAAHAALYRHLMPDTE